MKLDELRQKIDQADAALLDAFCQRMSLAAEVGREKQAMGKPILDPAREREKLRKIVNQLPPDLKSYGYPLYDTLFALSRSYQQSQDQTPSPLRLQIEQALTQTPKLFPPTATVACQGVEGAYSQIACEKLFAHPSILYFQDFASVFSAVENGLCDYAVLPVENSTAGSVQEVYDLMLHHRFSIVQATRLKVDHTLLAKPGVTRNDVKEIFSHPQALSQCAAFLKDLPDVKITPCKNTAAAAELVASSDRRDIAAISSHRCAELYSLSCLAGDIQDRSNNYTRFICISKKLEIYPGADKTSFMMVLPHRPGSLHEVLGQFDALGLNLIKLESRPLPQREFEFMFYFDLESSVYSEAFPQMVDYLGRLCERVQYLGTYREVL